MSPNAAWAQSWGISGGPVAPSRAVVGTPFPASIQMQVTAGSFSSADLSAVDFYPSCTKSNQDCGGGVYEDVAALGPATGVGEYRHHGMYRDLDHHRGPSGPLCLQPTERAR